MASDGFSKTFPYAYIYTPNPRQGPMGITWFRADQGYVSSYTDGMRLVMFADAKTNTYGWNTSGWHVFGNADMRDSWVPNDWYNYSGIYPSSGGVSVKWISDILIYSDDPVPPDTGNIEVTSDPSGAEIFINTVDTGFTTPHLFTGKVVGSYDVYVTRSGYITPGTQTKSVTKDATTSYSFTLSPVPPVVDTLYDVQLL